MTTRYVWSGATGAADGTSWADAYTSIASVAPSDGDLVLIASDHSETPGATLGGSGPDEGVRWISANRTTDAYEAGASFTISTTRGIAPGTWRGCTFTLGATLGDNQASLQLIFVDCTFVYTGGRLEIDAIQFVRMVRCTLIWSAGSTIGWYISTCLVDFIGCTFTGGWSTSFFYFWGGTPKILLRGCDLSGLTDTFVTSPTSVNTQFVTLLGCKLPAGFNIGGLTYDRPGLLLTLNCYEAAPGATPLQMKYRTGFHDIELATGVYRDGGAAQDEVAYSWRVQRTTTVFGADGQDSMGALPPMRRWVAGGSAITVDVHLIHDGNGAGAGGDLREDEVIMELMGPPESGEAAHHVHISGDPTSATPGDLASSSETWTGTAFTNKQKLRHTYSPAEDGWLEVRLLVSAGRIARDIYVCPKLEVS